MTRLSSFSLSSPAVVLLVQLFVVLAVLTPQTSAFAKSVASSHRSFHRYISTTADTSTRLHAIDPGLASVLAGSLAGSIGVGMAFPLDTLKTKAQLLSQRDRQVALEYSTVTVTAGEQQTVAKKGYNMMDTAKIVLEQEGVKGFFAGVNGVMAGEAVIKAVAFSVNAKAFSVLQDYVSPDHQLAALLAAACLSGLATSFFVAPVERIKVMMQASPEYENELQCLRAILANEGWQGLFRRGLGPTLLRDVPSYGIYFGIYAVLSQTVDLGPFSSVVFGATAGSASWIPVYPVDVVKTLMQNTAGEEKIALSAWQVMLQVYQQGGISAFFQGMTPKVLRAAVNHAATFTIYDTIMHSMATIPPQY